MHSYLNYSHIITRIPVNMYLKNPDDESTCTLQYIYKTITCTVFKYNDLHLLNFVHF